MPINRKIITASVIAQYGSFANYIAALGSTNTTEVIAGDVTVEAPITQPSNITFSFVNDAKLICSSGAKITNFKVDKPYNHQIVDCALADVPTITGLEYVTPEMFGGVGDGVTDDTDAIKKGVASHKNIYIAATYIVSSAISLSAGHTIFGAGTLKGKAATVWNDTGFLQCIAVTGVKIKDVTLDGNKTNNASGRSYGIRISNGANNIRIENVKSINHPGLNSTGVNGGDGLYIEPVTNRCYDIIAENCTFTGNVRNNISIISGKDIKIINCDCSGATGNNVGGGIDIEPDAGTADSWSENITIEDCNLSGNYVGIQIYNTKLASIKNIYLNRCNISGNTTRGIRFHSVNDDDDGGEIVVSGCNIVDNGERGVFLDSYAAFGGYSKNIKFLNNFIHGNAQEGILVDQDNRYCTFKNNTITRNGYDGIKIDWATNGSSMHHDVEGNHVFNNSVAATGTYCGIRLLGNSGVTPTAYCNIVGNFIGNRQFINSTSTQQDGIIISGYSDNNVITLNQFHSCLGRGVYIDPNADNNTITYNVFNTITGNGIEIDTGAQKTVVAFNKHFNFTTGTDLVNNGTSTSIIYYDDNNRIKYGIGVSTSAAASGFRIEEPTGTISALIVKKTDTTQGNGAIAKFQNMDNVTENTPVIVNEGNSATDDGSPLCVGANSGNSLRLSGTVKIGTNQIITSRQTGVSAMINLTAPSNLDADTVTVAQLADIVGNLINKLRTHGLIGD